ncbi:MAG: Bax inhibitor-1/YccA family protein [Beijerinckiaceae bacterium]
MANFDRNAYPTYGSGMAGAGAAVYDQGLRSYMLGIYNHMVLGLAISGLVAFGMFMLATTTDPAMAVARMSNGTMLTEFGRTLYVSPLKWLLMLAPLAFIFVLSWRSERASYTSLLGMFWAFATVMGVSMATIFMVFTSASIAKVFFITAATFGALSLWAYTTKRSLSGWGTFLFMGLVGLIIASIVNIFMQSSALQFAISCIGVLVFAGFTAYDTQRLKEQYDYVVGDAVAMGKASIMGALSLYLDFINLFQSLLSILGDRE